jgi:hypothetical protein
MDYWKWFIRLGIGPNGEVYYHGNNESSMGDRQLGLKKIGAVTYLMMLALSQNKLHIHGGFPDIEGIEPAELSAAMKSIYRSIKDHDYKRVVAALKRMAWRNESKEATQAASMLYYVMAIARKELAKSSDALDDGDFVLAKTLFDASKANFGMTETHKEFFEWLREETSKEENASRLQRGRRFYSLMKAHEKDPKRAEHSLKAFVAADVDGYYSKKAVLKKIRDQVLAELRNRK